MDHSEDGQLEEKRTGTPVRCPSQASSVSTNQEICRICHWEGDGTADSLLAPCYCSGSLRWVHQHCLQQWIKSSDIKCCELCKFQFVMSTKLKSFSQWEGLQMSALEKRKLACSVAFHGAALTCVLWSLYVLIDRTVEELDRGSLDWPFWTKLIVVAFGVIGGVVFMYIQCKAYLNLCRRWRALNRVIYIQNAPEKHALPPDSAPSPLPLEKKPCPPCAPTEPLVSPSDCVVTICPSTDPKRLDSHDNSSDEGETYALLNV